MTVLTCSIRTECNRNISPREEKKRTVRHAFLSELKFILFMLLEVVVFFALSSSTFAFLSGDVYSSEVVTYPIQCRKPTAGKEILRSYSGQLFTCTVSYNTRLHE